jgi:hypothetical protein
LTKLIVDLQSQSPAHPSRCDIQAKNEKTPRQTSAGFFEFFPGCLAVFSVEQVAFKSPRMVGVKSKKRKTPR